MQYEPVDGVCPDCGSPETDRDLTTGLVVCGDCNGEIPLLEYDKLSTRGS